MAKLGDDCFTFSQGVVVAKFLSFAGAEIPTAPQLELKFLELGCSSRFYVPQGIVSSR
jgi:hypothetical protein